MALTEEQKKKAEEEYERKQKLVASSKKSKKTASDKKKPQDAGNVNSKNTTSSKNTANSKTSANSKTETKPKVESKTEVTPKKTANNAAGKAQQFSNIANKPASVSAKAVSSEAPTLENRDAIKKETQKNKSIFTVTQDDKINLQNREQLKSEQQAKANSEVKKFVDNILKNAANDKEIKKQVTVDNRDAIKAQIQNDVWKTNPEGSYASNLARGLGNRFRSTVGNSIEEMAGAFVDSTDDVVQGYSFGDEINLDNREAARAYAMGQNSAWFVDPLKAKAEEIANARNAGKVYDLATEQIASAQEGTNSQFARDMISAADSGVQMAAYMTLPGGNKYLSAYMAIPAAAERYNEERAKGASKEEAATRAAATGAISYAVESLGGIGKYQSNVIEEIAAKNFFTNLAAQFVAEGGEELLDSGLQYVADVLADLMYKGEIQTTFDPSEMLHKAWVGGLSGAGFGLTGSVSNSFTGNTQQDATIKEVTNDIVAAIKNTRNTKDFSQPKNIPTTEAPVSPAEAPIVEAENVTPETANEQEGAFANAGEDVETESENNVAEAPEKTLETLKEQFDKGEISKEEYLAKNYENLSKYFEERKNANAQVNSTNDVVNSANDVIEPANAQPRAQKNIPQEVVAPKNRTVIDPESEMEYISEEDYDGAQTNGNFGKNTVGSAQLNNTFYKSLDEFGAQPLRKEQIANGNEMRVPKKISENEAITENVGYMLGSKLADNDYMDDVIQHPEKYAHIINTDANSMQNAIDYIQNNGLDETYGAWRKTIDDHKMVEKDDISKAYLLGLFYQNKAKNETDPAKKEEYRKRALDIKTDINYAASKGGQLLQGIQMLQKAVGLDSINLKEDGEYMAARLVEKLNADRKGKGKEIVLNKKLVDKAIAAAGTDAEGKAWDEVYKDLANQTSTSFWQRVNNYRYWCMLSNPRTHIRNVVSNMSMAIVNVLKDATKVPVEAAFNAYAKGQTKRAKKVDDRISQLIASGKTNDAKKLENKAEKLHRFDNAQQKTTAIYYPKDYTFAIKDFDNAKKIFDTSGKYDSNTNNFIRENKTNQNSDPISTYLSKKIEGNNKFSKGIKTVLEHGAFGSVMDLNSWLLSDVEDGSFKSLTYAHELAQRMRANGITAETATNPENIAKMDKIRAEAFAEALYNTFNEDSKLADSIKNFSNKSVAGYLISETLLPFKKVPINILKTASDYSPIGVFKGIGEMAKVMHNPTSSDPGKAINDIAKGLTGLELMALGAFLRSIGKITNGLSDDDDEKNFQKLLGEQAFAIKFDDGSYYSMEWLGSSVMPLFAGALAYDTWNGELKNKVNSKNFASVAASGVAGTLASIANPMIEMSMLSNIEYLLTNQYNDIEEVVVDVLGDYANQFVPQVLNAITKTTDNTKRNVYYVDKTDNISDIIQVPYQTAISKIPGKSQNLSAQVDAWGRVKTHSDRDSKLGWAFDALISPGTYKKDRTTEADKMVAQLVKKTGNTNLYPSGPSQKYVTVDNVKYPLSAKEYEQMSIEKGKKQYDIISQLVANKTYEQLDAETKAKAVKGVYEYSGALSKEGVHGYKLPKEWAKAENAKADGLAEGTYISLKSSMSGKEKDIDKMEYLIADKGTSPKEKVIAMEYLTDINMKKYEKFSKDPKDIINARMIYLEESAKGGEGTTARIVDRMIKDKGTNAKEDVAFMENVLNMNMEKYKSATGNSKEQLELYKVVSDDAKKEEDIKALTKKGYSNEEALAKYNVSSGTKKYEKGEFKFGNSTKQKAKAEKLKAKGYDPKIIVKAANAVTSIGKYGTSKSYSTCVKMLNSVGIKDKKFIQAFWNIYM